MPCQIIRAATVGVQPLGRGRSESRLAPGIAARRWPRPSRVPARRAPVVTSQATAAWFEQPLPDSRQEVVQWLDGMISWLRDVALATLVSSETTHADPRSWIAHPAQEGVLLQQARAMDLDRCLTTTFALLELRESIERFVNPRVVAGLAREKWLALFESPVHA